MNNDGYKRIEKNSVAPYNFVPLPESAIEVGEEHLVSHTVLNDEYLNGYIEFNITNMTPLVIGKAKKDKENKIVEPLIVDNKYIIPGNSFRGVLRNNAAILSLSNISDDIEDSNLYYRSFGKDKNRTDYNKRLDIGQKVLKNKERINAPRNIYAGYIYKEDNGDYVILPVSKENDLNYYCISEQYLRRNNLNIDEIKYMYDKTIKDLIINKEKYKSIKVYGKSKKNPKKIDLLKKAHKNVNYSPYYAKISFELDGIRTVTKIGEEGKYTREGYLMSSQYMNGKLIHYIIPTDNFSESDKIVFEKGKESYKTIDYYNNDLIITKKCKIGAAGKIIAEEENKYYELPQQVGRNNGKPIFYGNFNGKVYIGFTPYLRIPYDYTIKDGINDKYKNSKLSYVDAMLGFTEKKECKFKDYKSRISVEDCVSIKDSNIKALEEYSVILSEPHPSSTQLYLNQDINCNSSELANYNDKFFRIRGIKQYWIREELDIPYLKDKGAKIVTHLRAIPKNTAFKGRINYKNLTKDELGLLIWSIKVNNKAHENIGMGKPYGFGNIVIDDIKVYKEELNKKYSSMSKDFYTSVNKDEYIEFYKNTLKREFNGIDIEKQQCYKEFLTLKTNVIKSEDKNNFRYMQISFKNNPTDIKGVNEFALKKALPIASKQLEINKIKINNNLDTSKKDYYKINKNKKEEKELTKEKLEELKNFYNNR